MTPGSGSGRPPGSARPTSSLPTRLPRPGGSPGRSAPARRVRAGRRGDRRARDLPGAGSPPRPGRRPRRQQLGHVPGEIDGRLAARGAVVVHVGADLDDSPGRRAAHRAGCRDSIIDAAVGDEVVLAGRRRRHWSSPTLRLVAPYPKEGSSPSIGQPALEGRRVRQRRSGPAPRLPRTPHRLSATCGPVPARRLPDRVRHDPGQRRDGQCGATLHHRAGHEPRLGGHRHRPRHPPHGTVIAGGGEAPQPERFAVSRSTAAVVNAASAAGGRVVAVGTTATRALESATDESGVVHAAAGGPTWSSRPAGPVRSSAASSRAGTTPTPRTCSSSSPWPARTSPRRPTAPRSPAATRGTSSGTRLSCSLIDVPVPALCCL